MSAHKHTDSSALNAGKNITWIGIGINSILIALKIYGGLAGKSRALLADAIHSISDLLTDFLVLIGLQFFRKPEDEGHPYGHGKIETLATIGIGALLLFAAFRIGASAVKAIYKGNLVTPGSYTVYIALASVALKEILYQVTVRVGKKLHSEAVIANAWHHRSDALSSVVALVGISLSVYVPRLRFLDSYAALVVSLFIVKVAIDILKGAIQKIIDTSPSKEFIDAVIAEIREVEGVTGCHDITARYYADLIRMEVHVEVDPSLTVAQSHTIADRVVERIKGHFPEVSNVLVHIDPYNDSSIENSKNEHSL